MTIRNLSLRTTGLGLNRNNTTGSNFNGIMKSYSTFDSSFKNKSTIKYANYLKYEHSSELNKNKS